MKTTSANLLIRNARLLHSGHKLNGKSVDILVEEGKLKTISAAGKRSFSKNYFTVLDGESERFRGLHVSAGWVDAFADYAEPGHEHKETIATGLEAAAAGGFTDVILNPATKPVMDNKAAVRFALERAKDAVASLHPMGMISQNGEGKKLAEMLDMQAAGTVAFSDGWTAVQQPTLLQKALEYVRAFDGLIVQLPHDAEFAAGGLMHEGILSTRLGMPGIPTLAETLMVHRDIELLRYTKSRLHITGVSTAASVALIRAAKAEGLAITCSVTPYHLYYTGDELHDYDSRYKVFPPLRPEIDREALRVAFADGTIDCLASHHQPQDWDAKTKEFEYAEAGMAMQQQAVAFAWQAVKSLISAADFC